MATTDVHFVFGYGDSFFVDTPKAWDWENLPSKCEVFNNQVIKANQIQKVHWVALGESDAYMVYGIREDGQERVWWNGPNTEYIYELAKTSPNNEVRTVFGANGSYYVIQPSAFSYSNIPRDLEMKRVSVEQAGDSITEVALGYDNRYVCLTKSGTYHWWLTQGSPLWKIMEEHGSNANIAHIALNPWNEAHYFVTFTDGSVKCCVPSSWVPRIKAVTDANGLTLSYETSVSNSQPSCELEQN